MSKVVAAISAAHNSGKIAQPSQAVTSSPKSPPTPDALAALETSLRFELGQIQQRMTDLEEGEIHVDLSDIESQIASVDAKVDTVSARLAALEAAVHSTTATPPIPFPHHRRVGMTFAGLLTGAIA